MQTELKVDWEKYAGIRFLGRNRLIREHHQDVVSDFIKFFSKISCESEIIDIGCSAGFFLVILRELGFQKITGLDISNVFVEQAKLKGLNCYVGNILNENDWDNTIKRKYDIVILMEILEHLEKPEAAVEIIYKKILKRNGVLFITTPIYDSLYEKYSRIKLKKTKIQQAKEQDPTHVQAFNRRKIHNILNEKGFKIVESKKFYCHIPRISNPRLRIIIRNVLPEFFNGKFLRVIATPK